MKIIITATLTEQEVEILSTLKRYPTEVTIFEDILTPYTEHTSPDGSLVPAGETLVSTPKQVPNPQTREDYLRQVYEGIVVADATSELTKSSKARREEQDRIEEEAIRESVQSSITSTIE